MLTETWQAKTLLNKVMVPRKHEQVKPSQTVECQYIEKDKI